jgi:hypothetical protein
MFLKIFYILISDFRLLTSGSPLSVSSESSVANKLFNQINLFMQNKPNFRKQKMNTTSLLIETYKNIFPLSLPKNKPNFKPNYEYAPFSPNLSNFRWVKFHLWHHLVSLRYHFPKSCTLFYIEISCLSCLTVTRLPLFPQKMVPRQASYQSLQTQRQQSRSHLPSPQSAICYHILNMRRLLIQIFINPFLITS